MLPKKPVVIALWWTQPFSRAGASSTLLLGIARNRGNSFLQEALWASRRQWPCRYQRLDLLSSITIPVTSPWCIPQLLLVAMVAAAPCSEEWLFGWASHTTFRVRDTKDFRVLMEKYSWHSLTQSRHLLMWSYRVNTSFWKELPCEGYLLETGTGRVEGRSKSRGRWSNREWIHSNSTGKMQRCCPATAPEHSEEQCSAGSSSLQWDVMENARAGRKEGKQVNYTGKLGQSTPGTL